MPSCLGAEKVQRRVEEDKEHCIFIARTLPGCSKKIQELGYTRNWKHLSTKYLLLNTPPSLQLQATKKEILSYLDWRLSESSKMWYLLYLRIWHDYYEHQNIFRCNGNNVLFNQPYTSWEREPLPLFWIGR